MSSKQAKKASKKTYFTVDSTWWGELLKCISSQAKGTVFMCSYSYVHTDVYNYVL